MNKNEKAQQFDEVLAAQMTCKCVQRVDIKTFGAWKNDGLMVKKGEKSKRTKGNVAVFCRCQVGAVVDKASALAPAPQKQAPAKPVTQAQDDEFGITVKTVGDIVKVARIVAKKHFGLDFDIPVRINSRLVSTLGRYRSYRGSLFRPVNIEISEKLLLKYNNKEIVQVIAHEVCHWALHKQGKPHKDKDTFFKSEIKRIGSILTGVLE